MHLHATQHHENKNTATTASEHQASDSTVHLLEYQQACPHKPGGLGISIRAATGLSGDILLTGLARLAKLTEQELNAMVKSLKLPQLDGCLQIVPREVNGVSGWGARINLPEEHSHRHLPEILRIIQNSEMADRAKTLAQDTFTLLGGAEAKVHGSDISQVTFHEVGALDSILDTCLVCALFAHLNPARLVLSPLPLCDGTIKCAHGLLPSPAPAVLELLDGVVVRGLDAKGETLTPTAVALIKVLGAEFGQWPTMKIQERALVYGGRYFEGVPNGVIFASGELLS